MKNMRDLAPAMIEGSTLTKKPPRRTARLHQKALGCDLKNKVGAKCSLSGDKRVVCGFNRPVTEIAAASSGQEVIPHWLRPEASRSRQR
jgi:hypothetical protein